MLDQAKANQFMNKVVGDLGTSLAVMLVHVGDRVGLFEAMADAGPLQSAELAQRAGIHPRYADEWLNAMACAGYVEHDPEALTFTLPDERAMFFAAPGTEYYLGGLFKGAPMLAAAAPQVAAAFESGAGVSYQAYGAWVPLSTEQMNRAVYEARLVRKWLPAVAGAVDRLKAGGRAIDIGCGTGVVPILIAKAFPQARVEGLDFDARSIEMARSRAAEAGAKVEFSAVSAADWEPSGGYDLISTFDCMHDMPDPLGLLRRIRGALTQGGSYLMVEPRVGDRLQDNLANPFGKMLYGLSCMHCVPQSIAQGGPGLGACWGPGRARVMAHEAGFAQFNELPIKTAAQAFYELKA